MSMIVSTGYKQLALALFPSIFNGGAIEVFTGPPPTNANMAPTGTRVARITNQGLPWVAGNPANGLLFAVSTDGNVVQQPGQRWVITGLATGIAGYARLLTLHDTGLASTTAPRIDFQINPLDGSGIFMVDVSITPATLRDSTFFTYGIPPL